MNPTEIVADKIYQLYLSLLQKYGSPEKYWPQWCKKEKSLKDREIIALGAILTQRTSWRNAEMALANLKKAGLLSLGKIAGLDSPEPLVGLIRVAGFYQTKPKRLFEFCRYINEKYGGIEKFKGLAGENLAEARKELLSLYGIGPETADTILLYVLDKPSFVIDEYTRKLVKKEKLATLFNDEYLRNLFEKSLPVDARLFQDFHALIIFSQKERKGWRMRKM